MPDGPAPRPAVPHWLALSLLALTFSLPSLLTRDLWNPDEPRYAEVAHEMRVLGDYVVPHLNGDIYAEKPPLFFWLSALFQSLGFGFASGRIVTAVAAVGCLLLTREMARLWFTERAALLAAIVLSSTMLFTWNSKMGVLDVPLGFFTMLAVYGWFRHRRDGGTWSLLLFAGMGLATLIKGPVGILIPCLAVVATLLVPGRPAPRSRYLLWGGLLTMLIVGAWLVPACLQGGPEYTNTILFRQSAGRIVTSWSHQQPWHYYLKGLPAFLFPWVVFLPWAVVRLWRDGGDDRDGAPRRLILWSGLGLLVFSLISGKRGRYMIPFLPPLAILLGVFLDDALHSFRAGPARAWMKRLFSLQHALFFLLGLGLFAVPLVAGDIVSAARPNWERGPSALTDVIGRIGVGRILACGASLCLAAAYGWWSARRDTFFRTLGAALGATLVLSLGLDLLLTPGLNHLKSGREVGRRINQLVPPGGPGRVAFYPDAFSGVYNLYSGRVRIPVLSAPVEIDRFLGESPDNAVLTDRDNYRKSAARITIPHRVIEAKDVGHRMILFLVPGTLKDYGVDAPARPPAPPD